MLYWFTFVEQRNDEFISEHLSAPVAMLWNRTRNTRSFAIICNRNDLSGSFQKLLDGTTSIYKKIVFMCEVDGDKNLKEIPVMLTGDALLYSCPHLKRYVASQNFINVVGMCVQNGGKLSKTITNWQLMRFMEEMVNILDVSMLEMSWNVFHNLMFPKISAACKLLRRHF